MDKVSKILLLLAVTALGAAVFYAAPPADASPGVEIAAVLHEETPEQRGCDIEEFRYVIVATDGGLKGLKWDGGVNGGTVLAGDFVGKQCGDGVTVVNNTAVPLQCRARTAAGSAPGVTICNTTACTFSNGIAEEWSDPCEIECNLLAVNRDAGKFAFTGQLHRACR